MKKLVILDTFVLIFKAYYAFIRTPLTTSSGKPSSAIFGFMKMFLKLFKDIQPDYLAITLDHPKKTFRHDIYPQYKANRGQAPQDLLQQIPVIIQLLQKFGFATLEKEGYEADDLIGSLCQKYQNSKNLTLYIFTGDKDILQLVSQNVKVCVSKKGTSQIIEYDREQVKSKWGVYPENIVDLFALMGDQSDNIPGIPGIGPKTAQTLLQKYHNLENIYQNIHQVSPQNIRQKLIQDQKQAFLSQKLVKIKTDIKIDQTLQNFQNPQFNHPEGIQILKDYELQQILNDDIFQLKPTKTQTQIQIHNSPPDHFKSRKKQYSSIQTQNDWSQLIQQIQNSRIVSIDTETTSTNWKYAKLIGVSLSLEIGKGYFVPIVWEKEWKKDTQNNLNRKTIQEGIQLICEDRTIAKIGQNIKYDYLVLKKELEVEIRNIIFDTMLASYILNVNRQSHSLDYLALEFLNYQTIKYQDIVGEKENLLDVPLDQVVQYASEDAEITLELYYTMKQLIDAQDYKYLFYGIEVPLLPVLAEMEINGVKIDEDKLKQLGKNFDQKIQALEQEIWKNCDQKFNINSPKQVGEILFEKLKVKNIKKTKTGYSTSKKILEKIGQEHQIGKLILEYRKLIKLKTGYIESLPKLKKNQKRLHTSFNQTITHTGRLSSTHPNLQNIPIKDHMGQEIRQCFVAEQGYHILSADYSQIELRILAHLSQDQKLIQAYEKNNDLHKQTAQILFDKPQNQLNEDERRIGKIVNFSIIYGIGAISLGKDLKIPTQEAKQWINKYFEEYHGVKEYIEKQKRDVHQKGFVQTLFGRIREIKEIHSQSSREKSFGERLAINTPIQGSSADIIKIAMISIQEGFENLELKSFMTIQVHDELVFEVLDEEMNTVKNMVIHKMEKAANLLVPLKVNTHSGKSWFKE